MDKRPIVTAPVRRAAVLVRCPPGPALRRRRRPRLRLRAMACAPYAAVTSVLLKPLRSELASASAPRRGAARSASWQVRDPRCHCITCPAPGVAVTHARLACRRAVSRVLPRCSGRCRSRPAAATARSHTCLSASPALPTASLAPARASQRATSRCAPAACCGNRVVAHARSPTLARASVWLHPQRRPRRPACGRRWLLQWPSCFQQSSSHASACTS